MEFGRVSEEELDCFDHSLPEDSAATKLVLASSRIRSSGRVHFGCAKWAGKEWKNILFPEETKMKDYPHEYANHFSCIELNSSFYKIYDDEQVRAWARLVGNDFIFCPKFYQGITHYRWLKNCDDLTALFLRSISNYGRKLGPCFLQLPNNFGTKHFLTLQNYLLSLPKDLEVFVEVRHKDWFLPPYKSELFEFLSANRFGWVTTDTSGRRDCVHAELPIPKAFIRFVGNNMHPTDYPRIDAWVERIRCWLDAGIKEVYFMMHQHDEAKTPIISQYAIGELNSRCGLDIKMPTLLPNISDPMR